MPDIIELKEVINQGRYMNVWINFVEDIIQLNEFKKNKLTREPPWYTHEELVPPSFNTNRKSVFSDEGTTLKCLLFLVFVWIVPIQNVP